MTDQDRQQQKVTLLLELQAAKDELARLEENAKRLATEIRQVADWIESAASPYFHQKMEIHQKHNRISSENRPKRYSEALNFQTVADVVALVIKGRKKMDNLQQRWDSLGID